MSGFLVVASTRAGSSDSARVAGAVAALAGSGPTELAAVDDTAALDAALHRLDGRTLVVAGGDGSLHTVVSRLWVRGVLAGVDIGVVPLGTGNDFARGVGLPLDPADAARRIARGVPSPIDLVVDDSGGVVVNAAHAGVGAEAAQRSASLKRRLGPLAYPVGAALAGLRARGWRLRIDVDGEAVVDGSVLLAGVGNGPTIGGGAPLHPAARVDDGRLDVVVIAATPSRSGRLALGAALRRGRHVSRDDVVDAQGATVRIAGEPVRHNVDGEVTAPLIERTYRVVPAAWRLVA